MVTKTRDNIVVMLHIVEGNDKSAQQQFAKSVTFFTFSCRLRKWKDFYSGQDLCYFDLHANDSCADANTKVILQQELPAVRTILFSETLLQEKTGINPISSFH
jgi:hypothetical protein